MSRLILILVVLILCVFDSPAQEIREKYKSRWQVKQAFGYNFPLTKLVKSEVTDHLIDFSDRSVYWEVLSATHFFSKHWGIAFNFQLSQSGTTSKRMDKFIQHFTAEYPNYHPVIYTSAIYDRNNIVNGDIERGYLGCIYRFESDRLFIYPKFSVGVTSFYTDYGAASLKEKNTNNVIVITYVPDGSPGSAPNDHITLAASSAIGYKLSNRFFVNIDVATSWYKTNFSFVKTTTNRYTGHETSETSHYKTNIFTLNAGIGLIFVIR